MVFGTTKEEVTEGLSKLHGEDLHGLFFTKYYSGNDIKEDEKAEICGTP
jgi:hypothetical protein